MEYGRIIKHALEITWKHKVLWVFGAAAMVFGARGGGNGHGGGQWNALQYTFGSQDIARWRGMMRSGWPFPFGPWSGQGVPFTGWQGLIPVVLGFLGILLVLAFVALIVGIVVRYTSLGALAGMVNEVEESERTSFGSGLRQGWGRMLRLLAIDLLIGVAVFVAVLALLVFVFAGIAITIGPAVGLADAGGAATALGIVWGVGVGLGFLLAFLLLVLALVAAVTLVREFAFRACVIDKKGIFDALKAGLRLVRRHLREAVLMWLVLLGIGLLVGLVAVPLALLGGAGGLVAPAVLVYRMTHSWPMALVATAPFMLVLIPLGILVGGIYLTFQSAVWTLTYRELRDGLEPIGG